MNFFTGIFQGFCLVSSNTYLKTPLSGCFRLFQWRDLQGSTYFLGKYYSQEYLNVKIQHS